MPAFSAISIIYNPNSTGNGKAMATKLQKALAKKAPKLIVYLAPTEFAGHGEQLAYDAAKASARPLVISASGDGGYHDVVNGIVRANADGAHAVAGLLPAGNANDHHREVSSGDMVEAITEGNTDVIDLICMKATVKGKPYTRYAHSYIGFGLTPQAGHELNQVDVTWFNELWIVARSLFVFEPVKVRIGGKDHIYDSLVFSNVSKMSKVFTLSKDASPVDGKFEITIFRRLHKLRLLMRLLRASTGGLSDAQSVEKFKFIALKKMLVQIDGEVTEVDANSRVDIAIAPKALDCIV